MEQIYLNGTLEVIARLPCVEMRLPIFSCLNSCLVALVCPAGGFILLRSSKVFDLSRQIVCSFVTLGHSGLGWAQSQQGRRRRRKIFCTILNSWFTVLRSCSVKLKGLLQQQQCLGKWDRWSLVQRGDRQSSDNPPVLVPTSGDGSSAEKIHH